MKKVERWRWDIESTSVPGKRVKTNYHLTEEEALERDPCAERLPGTLEISEVPETLEEISNATYGRGMRGWTMRRRR
jgi:hypothetical protein